MLCRTASDLYWLSRHVERVDNTARLLDLTQRLALLPQPRDGDPHTPWIRALETLGLLKEFRARQLRTEAESVQEFLLYARDCPSSVAACVRAARESARAQRVAITAEMYEELNGFWLNMRSQDPGALKARGLPVFLDWLKRRAAAFRGVTIGTLGRDEAYAFLRLGTFVERADFSVRLLDLIFDDAPAQADGIPEYFRLSAFLQATSAFEAYRKTYKDVLTPARVAEQMILRRDMPRSLAVCLAAIHDSLERLSAGRSSEAVRLSGAFAAELRYARIDEVLSGSIDAYLQRSLRRIHHLAEVLYQELMLSTDVIAH